jgi:cytochrome c-type biogenesis protein CcmH
MSSINLNSASVWLFIAVAVALACVFGASLYWASATQGSRTPRGQRLWLVLAAPLLVAVLYVIRGQPGAIAPPPPEARFDMAQMKAAIEKLASRLKDHPEDLDGWLMLARSYAVLGRPAEASDAFEHAQARAMQNPGMLAIWIEMRWRMNNGKFDTRAQELLERATALAPDNPDVLLLRALAANERGDKAGATALVETLRARSPPGGPERAELDAIIEKLLPSDVSAQPGSR